MRVESKTVVLDGNKVDVHYERPEGKVSITLALQCSKGDLHDRLLTAAQAWLRRLTFDLYICNDQVHTDGKTITLELDCPMKQDAVIRKLPYLFESLKSETATEVDDSPSA